MHRAFPILALVVLAAVAAATVPALGLLAAPAAVAWGRGFAAGGLAALLATLLALRSTPSDRLSAVVAVAAMQFAGLAAVVAAVHWSGTAILDGLAGIAAGWLVTSLVLHRGAQSVAASGVGFVTALCAAAALGHFRQAAAAVTPPWISAALVLGALGALTLLAIGIAAAYSERRRVAPESPRVTRDVVLIVLACVIAAGAAYAVATRTLHEPRFLAAAGIGLALPLVLAWLLLDDEHLQAPGGFSLDAALGVLVTLGAAIAAFYALAGYGIGIMLIAASLPAGLILALGVPRGATAPGDRLVQLLLFGAVLVVYRVFVQRFQDDLGAAALTDHLAMFSMIVGAVLPSILGGILGHPQDAQRPSDAQSDPTAETSIRLVLTFAGATAFGAALLGLWGPRAGLGFLNGLLLGAALPGGGSRAGLLALAAALPLIQWSHTLLAFSAQTRAEKARVVMWLVGIAIAVVAGADLWGRLTRRARPNAAGPLIQPSGEGGER